MQSIRIVLLATFAAIAYGILHDQVTARICVEYFTIGHPPVFPTTSPTLLALGWGILATWWVGLPLGILLAIAARAGSRPRLTAAQLRRPILTLLVVMGSAASWKAQRTSTVARLVARRNHMRPNGGRNDQTRQLALARGAGASAQRGT